MDTHDTNESGDLGGGPGGAAQEDGMQPGAVHGGMAVAVLMVVLGVAVFAGVAADLHYHGALQQLDDPLRQKLFERSTPWGVRLFSGVSYLGDWKIVAVVAIGVGVWLWKRVRVGWKRTVWLMAGALVGSVVVNLVLKEIWKVPRPGRWTYYAFEPGSGYSFPSGHTMGVGVMAGMAVLAVMHHVALPIRTRWLLGLSAAALTVLTAFSLLYMGVHTLTDVVAGLGVVCAWVGVWKMGLPARAEAVKFKS